ncbi:restriction endonuclease subunit S [Roseibium sp.]|uniref:restriction endonuclease subunit S n=1 Tax=Roseibium sp. TaxID=1936156 RepID=UPI003A976722
MAYATNVPVVPQAEDGPTPVWTMVKLDDVARRGSGHTPRKSAPEYWHGEIPWISLQDSAQLDQPFLNETAVNITPAGVANSSAKLHPAGTVVLSRDAGVGRSTIMAVDMAVSQHFIAWTCGPRLLNTFLYYYLQSQKGEFERIAIGSTIKTIGLPYFKEFQVPLPPLKEQQAIAEALSDADALIEGLERLIAKKRLIKQGAMQDLLTAKRRLPGFSGKWETKRLAEIGQVKTGLTYSPKNVSSYGTLVLRSSNIQNDRLAFADNVFVDLGVSDEATVRTGDLLICVRNGSRQLIGKTAMIDQRADGMAFGAFMSAYRSELNDYLVWCFQSSVIQKQVAEHLGATINQITNKTLKAIEVPLPLDDEERKAISLVLTDMDAEIQALEIRFEKARQVKEGMMQNLLTGRIRLT